MSEATENRSNSNLAIVVFLGLTILLAAVFLSARGADVGRLPELLAEIYFRSPDLGTVCLGF